LESFKGHQKAFLRNIVNMILSDLHRFRGQFLFTKNTSFNYAWKKVVIKNYNLFFHPEIVFTNSTFDNKELIMLGSIYDWETPELSNKQLLDILLYTCSFENFLKQLSKYSGQYIMLYCEKDNYFLLNDTAAQCEIFYDTSFVAFGSQPKLLCEVIAPEPHTSEDAVDFYNSREFLSRRIFVGDTTHFVNIKRLLSNHYIEINTKSVIRYFPSISIARQTTKEVVPKACQMLKGYIKAAAMRQKIAMGVTGGYDSRVLFLSSLDEKCKYYVVQHKNMTAKHHDIIVPRRLTKMYGRLFEVFQENDTYEEVSDSIDFPGVIPKIEMYSDEYVYLYGNISEIARNFYGYRKNISANDLAFFNGYGRFTYAKEIYGQWLECASFVQSNGYDILDLYYWEQRIGIIGTAYLSAIGKKIFSPYGSRDLLNLLLSTPRKDRDHYINRLYDSILLELSHDALKIPINPCKKHYMIRLMTRLKIYNIYKDLGMKYRFLKY